MVSERTPAYAFPTILWISLHLTSVGAYNVETRDVKILSPADVQEGSWFGHSITLQPIRTGELDVFVGAPLHKNEYNGNNTYFNDSLEAPDGVVYKCSVSDERSNFPLNCTRRYFGENSAAGMTILEVSEDKLLVCGPQWTYRCSNAKLPIRMVGECYILNATEFTTNDPDPLPSPCITDCPGGVDIVFLLDSSGSVNSDDFITAKKWLVSTMSGFSDAMARDEVHVGFIQYSATTTFLTCDKGNLTRLISVELPLGNYDLSYASEKVMNATPFSQCTLTGDSINVTVGEFITRGREQNAAVMVVITDGKSSDDVEEASNHARNHGIHMIAIGVGTKFNMTELELIANNNGSIFTVANFSSLNSILSSLQEAILAVSAVTLEGKAGNATSNLTQCMMGMSSAISESGTLHLGATGACDAKGTIISRALQQVERTYVASGTAVKTLLGQGEMMMKDSYLGYSVSTGHFFGQDREEWTVTGVPRYRGYGAIVLYKQNYSALGFKYHQLISSPADNDGTRQLGTYFGYTICTLDVNGDGADDLLVGAPLHSVTRGTSSYDEGCVLLYNGNSSDREEAFPVDPSCTLQGFHENSRFGASIAEAGDLDRDMYQDFVIGAIGYNDNMGEIYVYYGDANCPHRFQRIAPSELGTRLQYFGFTVAVLDDPKYGVQPLIVATSPKSQSLMLLRTRPVIDLNVTLVITNVNNEEIGYLDVIQCSLNQSFGAPCAMLSICFDLSWRDAMQVLDDGKIEIAFDLGLDVRFQSRSKRMVFEGSRNEDATMRRMDYLLGITKECMQYEIILRPNILSRVDAVDFSEPMEVSLLVKLSDDFQKKAGSPVLPFNENRLRKELIFHRGCSMEDSCFYDLTIGADVTEEKIIEMDRPDMVIPVRFTIENKGDPAFFTKVSLAFRNVDISRISSNCAYLENDRITIVLRDAVFGSLFMPQATCIVEIMFNLIPLVKYANETEIEVNATVFSSVSKINKTNDANAEDNTVSFKKEITYYADIKIVSVSTPGDIRYWRNFSGGMEFSSLTQQGIFGGEDGSVIHTYRIRNAGPFVIPAVTFTFTWPAFRIEDQEELPILYLFDFSCYPPDSCTCNSTIYCDSVNPWKLPYDTFNSTEAIQERSQCPVNINSSNEFPFRFKIPAHYPFSSNTEVTPALCDYHNSSFECSSLYCGILRLQSHHYIEVQARFKLWIPTLKLKKVSPSLHVGSSLHFDLSQSPVYPKDILKQSTITSATQYFSAPQPEKPRSLDTLLILVAILIGLAILAISILICWKCGFFESKYKKMRKELRPSEEEREVIATIASANKKPKGKRKSQARKSSLVAKIPAEEVASLIRDVSQQVIADANTSSKGEASREDLYLEMTPMKKYRAERNAFQSDVRKLTYPRHGLSAYEGPVFNEREDSPFEPGPSTKETPPLRPIPSAQKRHTIVLDGAESGKEYRGGYQDIRRLRHLAQNIQSQQSAKPIESKGPEPLVSPSALFPEYSFVRAEDRGEDVIYAAKKESGQDKQKQTSGSELSESRTKL